MKHTAHIASLIGLLVSLSVPPARVQAVEYIPVASGLFTTGQWYFEGEKSSLAGNASLTMVPALKFSNQFNLIPTFSSSYRGTRSAEELAGGKNLFQDTWENGVSVKAVQGLGERWKLRGKVGFRSKWFRETSDEKWNKGLYDYRTTTVGTEAEHLWRKDLSVALGYDFSLLQFPNYVSLESQQDSDLAREFAGDNVLDANIHILSLRANAPLFWKMNSQLESYISPRYYTDQHVVELTGLYTSETRKDNYSGGGLALERMFATPKKSRLLARLRGGYASLDSNQNHYDAQLTTFIPDYYDYNEKTAGLQFTLMFGNAQGRPMLLDAGYSYSRRDYRSRVTQDKDANYRTDKLYIAESTINLGYSYPLSKNFRLHALSSFGRSKSNNDYEAVYRYNYSSSSYQFGFSYDY